MRRTVIALLLLASGAATAVAQTAKQNPPAQAPQTGHCDIGVLSRLGTTFSAWNGVVIGGINYADVPIESWHVDDLVVDRFRAALGNRGAVDRIPYRKEDFQGFGAPLSVTDFLFNARREENLRRMTTGMRCARYVIISRGGTAHGDGGDWSGLGIRVEKDIFFPARAFVHAVIAIRVYDGKTFARLRERTYEFRRKVDESFWPDPPNSAAQNAKLREVTRELVTQSLDEMLPKLLLTP